MKKTDPLCILPFIHQEIQQDGNVYLCCRAQWTDPLGNLKEKTSEENWNSDRMQQVRGKLLLDQWPVECASCKKQEVEGEFSLRQLSNEKYKNKVETFQQFMPYKIKFLGLRLSNLCNLKCIYCSSVYSSRWANSGEEIIYPTKSFNEIKSLLLTHKDWLEEIYIAGGEPLIEPLHLDLLEFLISENMTNITLEYNTNLSKLSSRGKDLIQIWGHFKKVKLGASIDDMGQNFEKIREGGNWKSTLFNIYKVLNSNIELSFFITISTHNIFSLDKFILFILENLKLNPGCIDFNYVFKPEEFSIEGLSLTEKLEVRKRLDKLKMKIINNQDPGYKKLLINILTLCNKISD